MPETLDELPELSDQVKITLQDYDASRLAKQVASYFISQQHSIDQQYDQIGTLLHWALSAVQLRTARLLIELGADVRVRHYSHQFNAFQQLCLQEGVDDLILKTLSQMQDSINAQDLQENTALHFLYYRRHIAEYLQFYQQHSSDGEDESEEAAASFHEDESVDESVDESEEIVIGIYWSQFTISDAYIIYQCLQYGADPNLENERGQSFRSLINELSTRFVGDISTNDAIHLIKGLLNRNALGTPLADVTIHEFRILINAAMEMDNAQQWLANWLQEDLVPYLDKQPWFVECCHGAAWSEIREEVLGLTSSLPENIQQALIVHCGGDPQALSKTQKGFLQRALTIFTIIDPRCYQIIFANFAQSPAWLYGQTTLSAMLMRWLRHGNVQSNLHPMTKLNRVSHQVRDRQVLQLVADTAIQLSNPKTIADLNTFYAFVFFKRPFFHALNIFPEVTKADCHFLLASHKTEQPLQQVCQSRLMLSRAMCKVLLTIPPVLALPKSPEHEHAAEEERDPAELILDIVPYTGYGAC